ncbi:hypothetical protein DFH08DRAFT_880097 [Mycena albidolilacea]|uniref:Uncharacterized protein n=1 Tax=Mycena albidolilacea TaxID=1033008 RepID=A0AAD7EK58_9AGAR|nr:hypothetical protein DFH08DRAFT_880097 [Mycena albidolilacea]
MFSFLLLLVAATRFALADEITVTNPVGASQCASFKFAFQQKDQFHTCSLTRLTFRGDDNVTSSLQFFNNMSDTSIFRPQAVKGPLNSYSSFWIPPFHNTTRVNRQ